MLNVGVVSDSTWDNYILTEKKLKKLNSEKFRIHGIYGKTLDLFQNLSNKHYLTLNRHYSDNISNTIYNMLKICDIWLIFTNHIEYLTSPSLIIELCDKYNIKYIIIGEYSRENDYYSFECDTELSFKKLMNGLTHKTEDNCIEQFNHENYNDNYISRQFIPICISPSIKGKIRSSYEKINDSKKSRCIKLLYDKDELKREKQMKKTAKEANQLQFMNNRLAYYKNITP